MMFHKLLLKDFKVNQGKNIKVLTNQLVMKFFSNLRGRSHFYWCSKCGGFLGCEKRGEILDMLKMIYEGRWNKKRSDITLLKMQK